LTKRYRNGKITEQFSTFEIDFDNGTRVIPMTPRWNYETLEFNSWQNEILDMQQVPVNDFWDELP
jgi:hypothetical protein